MTADFGPFLTEMNRGFLQILMLITLEEPMYGYAMVRSFGDMGYELEESTLYPLLRRLEKNGLIQSEWDVSGSRPKKYYKITPEGRAAGEKMVEFWRKQNDLLNLKLKERADE